MSINKRTLFKIITIVIIVIALLFNVSKLSSSDISFATKSINTNVITGCSVGNDPLCKMPVGAVALQSGATIKFVTTDKDLGNAEMKVITGGIFAMGSDEFEDSQPLHQVFVKSFLMDEHEVTNEQFAKFIKATGYSTVAERPLNQKDYPGVAVEKLVPGSIVFIPTLQKVSLKNANQWWVYLPGANWRHPKGLASAIKGKDKDPVVQVCYEDAAAYAQWAGKRLPTEAEWEFAARGGRQDTKYYWGDTLKPGGKWVANIFQGSFPNSNTNEDGYNEVAPVKSFAPNPYGLYDMDGNVWEWCNDFYRPDYYRQSPAENPQGPADSFDPEEPGSVKHVLRGGSFICSDQYCMRYKAGSRGKGETSSAGNNVGFRCVKDLK